MFFGGVAIILIAVFFRFLSIWVYGKDGEDNGDYNYYKRIGNKVFVIGFILIGLLVIIASFNQ